MNSFVSSALLLQEWLEKIDGNLKTVLQREPFTPEQFIMELYREISMQYVLCFCFVVPVKVTFFGWLREST